jgi:type I restriction enzyme S subunit
MKNWVNQKINEFCYVTDFVANGSFASLRENVTYINTPDYAVLVRLTDFTKKWSKDFVYVSKSSYEFLKKSTLLPDDLIMSNVGEPGIVFLVPDLGQPMTLGPNSILIRPNYKISTSRFLHYYFSSAKGKKQIDEISTGAAQKKFNKTSFRELGIPLPPLPEQQRIVSILDEAFAAIARAKANAEQNLKNAKELFESYLQRVFEKKGDGWEDKTLGEIAFVKSGGTPLRHKTEYWNGEIAWYSSGELNDLYTTNPERHINEFAIENSNAKLFPKGSLLIGMYDTAALKMSILNRDGTFNQAIAGVKPNPKIDLIFILHAINAIKPEILNLRRGVRQKNLSLEKIKNIPIPLPSLKEQQTIVRKLDALRAETQKLEAVYQKKIDDLEELKKSILQKAFSGAL